ncbi:hypothetical protein [Leptospirillum ferriphilum]|uniref:hypothetical protein n=1 Tax=Leptospirillum ferriphilum TaxID=178606 RepID=UPI0006B216B7|nr:hypothetical protein [Leptospirillum ferriphilum]
MKIVAAQHPLFRKSESPVAPESLNEALRASGLPEDASHIRFSQKGSLLFWSDDFPSFLREDLPLDAMEIFWGEVESWMVPLDRGVLEKFREMLSKESRGGVLFRVRRRPPYPEGRCGLFFRNVEDGFHYVLVGSEKGDIDVEAILNTPFFSREDVFDPPCKEWLTFLDDALLAKVAVQTLQEGIPDAFLPAVDVRPVRVPPGEVFPECSPEEVPVTSGGAGLARWWGTVVEHADTEKEVRVHATIRCGRVLPVLTVSADVHSLGTIGMSGFRKVLARISSRTLEAARDFSWSLRYRYVDGWKEPEGYAKEWASVVLGHLVGESGLVTLLPLRATRKDLPMVHRKTRPDEPYFWSDSQERLWIALRGTDLEKARSIVSPSVASRMSLRVEPPVSLQGFARMAGVDIPSGME